MPGLSTWTAEDLMEAGGWDDELVDLASLDEIEEIEDEGEEVGGLDLDD